MNKNLLPTIIFLTLVLVLAPSIFVFISTPSSSLKIISIVNLLLRSSGLLAIGALTIQLSLGAFMQILLDKFGSKVYRIHLTLGILSLFLILMHPIFYSVETYLVTDRFVAFLIPYEPTARELYISFGRLAFITLFVSILVARFRTLPVFRKYWLRIHVLNYLALSFAYFHAWLVGSDIRTFPYNVFFALYLILFLLTLAKKTRKYFYKIYPKPSQNKVE